MRVPPRDFDATLLIANRGEIAVRIIRTATELGINTVAIYADDDAESPHVHAADEAIGVPGYLDGAAILAAAKTSGAALIHPGYGFLSENAEFARACADAGYRFVGPAADVLELVGNKTSARAAASAAGVPVLAATEGPSSIDDIRAFFAAQDGSIMIKALAGGGGRGMRRVDSRDQIDAAYRQCAAEAQLGFGNPDLFAEAVLNEARHIEVQVVAAPVGHQTRALALGDRDCSVQRRYQKLVEIAPAQGLSDQLRRGLHQAATRLCARVGLTGVATVEFLVAGDEFVFLEINPRIQVEHTVTEQVTGVDLVAAQLEIAGGASFYELGLPAGIASDGSETIGEPAAVRGVAIQTRVNAETLAPDGAVLPSAGTLTTFTPPSGPGVRVDTYAQPGLALSPRYDSLLAKVITHVHGSSFPAAIRKARTALTEFSIEGVTTNVGLLRELLSESQFESGVVTTDFLDARLPELAAAALSHQRGVRVAAVELHPDEEALRAQMAGTVVEIAVEGAELAGGEQLVVLEAMKMQHVLAAPAALRTVRNLVTPGQVVGTGDALLVYTRTGLSIDSESATAAVDLDRHRADLEEVRQRHWLTLDEGRPAAVSKRHEKGRRTARENIADLVDPGSFVEYGALAIAAQRSRRSEEDLILNTPADGLVAGLATIGADRFGRAAAEAVVVSYDYTVLAGTQGMRNHAKTDRVFDLAVRKRLPVVLFAEGGGGRPGDTDVGGMAGLDVPTFRTLAALNGQVPLVAIVSGYCFAGNAALAGVSDVIIATPDANIGMGGPAMIEGGGLGVYSPKVIGPIDVQRRNGVVSLVARDEAHAVALAKQYLSYFQGSVADWTAPDPRLARHVVPENRLRAYDVRRAIESIVDVGSVLELRPDYGVGIVTALVRVEGVAYGLIANSSHHLGGAIDAEASDKVAEFLQLCESFRLPVISLCDTPGFMVGPEAEKEASVHRFGRMFIAGARLTVPLGMIILRKAYGLGAMAMAGGSFHAPEFTIAWPTGEIGGMGLEGAVRLGFSKELAAAADDVERQALFNKLVEAAYQHGKALRSATTFELDDVIDPAESRAWITRLPGR
ncbi:carbamoyl-phosphate-synthetase [Mycobacterium intermedium]|uniref:acetyl-CoA carboxylase n=1 Tax=Mycobacterium intermedium TaxID=28445 RepID=A0A1E3SBB7_MYCIE|nr:carboxyl transferase domain-containing protein [Mycobacterium intermedium]MCV6965849.1 carbamoyl-phosphate-synthetase [Mycobacterium intermedium]ODQ99455.1 carbamoyl-phosphate-synthetase [Mycobacterium intermedium]OPE50775.1 carbamoyl-phosphate-synthetase [Mycobacterium intermedium]ORB10052.1 carbamoyl-phosphate-synthetase [Mycobacterium intermedium]